VRTGEAARRAGVNVETLRYYERRGLLPEPVRAPGGHRRYDEEAVRFLRAIKEAQAVGFTLAEIEEYLRAVRAGRISASQALRVRMAAKIDEIDARIAGLRRMRGELARIVGCACESLDHCTCGAAYLARRGRDSLVRPSPLHVTNGESAGNTLRQTSLGGAVLPWQDVLHEGPLPAGSRHELLRTRAAFLSGCGWGSSRAILTSLERRDGQLLQALRDRQRVVLWFEHDLYDQLQLLDVLALASSANGAPEMIVVGSFPGKPSFRGLGELTADELETLWPSRVAATAETLAAAALAWNALLLPEPSELAALARQGVPQLPFLGPALRRLLEEFPSPQDGLSGTERRALQAIAAGATTPPAAFRAEQDLEEAPFLGDAWFYRTLSVLGRGEPRLIETQDDQPLPAAPPLGDAHAFAVLSLKLTTVGERVLSRSADRVELLGVDRWVGGTHITRATAWRWDPAAQLLTAPALPGPGGTGAERISAGVIRGFVR
jgi:DNA-binding transcriptional MerR regulator